MHGLSGGAGATDLELIRARLPLMQVDTDVTPDAALSFAELTELVLNTELEPGNHLHLGVYESISTGAELILGWTQLLSAYQR
jgi:hypothetical protein